MRTIACLTFSLLFASSILRFAFGQEGNASARGLSEQSASQEELLGTIKRLEERVKELEARLGITGESDKGKEAAEAKAEPAASPIKNSTNGFLNSLEITGFVDGYFSYNFNKPSSRTNQLRNFDFNHNQFGLNLIELALARNPDPLGFRLDLDFGPATDWVHASDPYKSELVKHFQQAYLSYKAPIGKGLTIDFGKFVTQHGAEVIETKDNWNYSRSLLFAWAIPYYHFGLRAGYPIHSKLTLNAYIVNGWNNVLDNNSGKTFGLQGVWVPHPKVTVVQNYMVGPEQNDNTSRIRHMFDTVITYYATEKLSLMLNYDYGMDRADAGDRVFWTGIGGYLRYAFTPWFAIAPRIEWFNDHNGFSTGQAQSLKEVTMTGEFKVANNLFTRLEYRRDWSDVPFFEKANGKSGSQTTALVGLFYVFGTGR